MATETFDGLPSLPDPWEIQRRLRCASICGFSLPPRIIAGLLACDEVTALDLYLYLRGRHRDTGLVNVVRTQYEHDAVTRAYARFYEMLMAPRMYRRSASEKLAWIVPDTHVRHTDSAKVTRGVGRVEVLNAVRESVGVDPYDDREILEWLPWMSLGVATRLRGWRSARISMLRRALFKLAGDLNAGTAGFYPWEPEFSPDARGAPLCTLYQYEACQLMRNSIDALHATGLTSVDDLRCLHPEAVAVAKAQGQPLLILYRLLRRQAAK